MHSNGLKDVEFVLYITTFYVLVSTIVHKRPIMHQRVTLRGTSITSVYIYNEALRVKGNKENHITLYVWTAFSSVLLRPSREEDRHHSDANY